MKTRIRVVECGDGRKEYYPESKEKFPHIIRYMFQNRPIAFVLFFYIAIPLAVIWSIYWLPIVNDGEKEKWRDKEKIELAKVEIDNYIRFENARRKRKIEKKISKKIVKTEYLIYP